MKFLNKKQILEAEDRKVVQVEVPEWGGTVRIKELDAWGRSQWDILTLKFENNEIKRDRTIQGAALVAFSVVDEDGKPIFTPEDVEALNQKNGDVIQRLFSVAYQLSFPSVDETAKN